jgi:hypothetical protein
MIDKMIQIFVGGSNMMYTRANGTQEAKDYSERAIGRNQIILHFHNASKLDEQITRNCLIAPMVG